ncbi:peroxiredoxin family protein [Amycolatopsis tucumanensis]|uniref:Thioredoxin domain-containing protein n=1 Tax=Amycolatopsis tucumanensis TaxID=401106 RepID=A0ABP7JIK7_9PSEU|nr:peroxiredoxin family protein [Amycolatopsis tucumanensis]MCF6425234.1 peroxiredoxin family protein [Amycolatopsis tucumanensis]
MSKTSSKTAKRTPAGKRARQIQTRQRQQAQAAARSVREARDDSSRRPVWIILGVVVVVLAVTVLYLIYQNSPSQQSQQNSTTGGSGYQHVAGQPGAGAPAPEFTLASASGGRVSLADFRGKNVLLYFQEGLSCQPCWDQIRDLEQNQAALKNAGVDAVVSITTDPARLIGQKMADEKLSTPVLSDPDLRVSRAYTANQYGMMGEMRDGHSFILVGPDGIIRWRADYGGAPDYTMFLPTQKMLADLTAERKP